MNSGASLKEADIQPNEDGSTVEHQAAPNAAKSEPVEQDPRQLELAQVSDDTEEGVMAVGTAEEETGASAEVEPSEVTGAGHRRALAAARDALESGQITEQEMAEIQTRITDSCEDGVQAEQQQQCSSGNIASAPSATEPADVKSVSPAEGEQVDVAVISSSVLPNEKVEVGTAPAGGICSKTAGGICSKTMWLKSQIKLKPDCISPAVVQGVVQMLNSGSATDSAAAACVWPDLLQWLQQCCEAIALEYSGVHEVCAEVEQACMSTHFRWSGFQMEVHDKSEVQGKCRLEEYSTQLKEMVKNKDTELIATVCRILIDREVIFGTCCSLDEWPREASRLHQQSLSDILAIAGLEWLALVCILSSVCVQVKSHRLRSETHRLMHMR